MKELYQQIPIETWKRIAYKVQRLKISDCSDWGFEANLKLLQKLLSEDTDVSLKLNKREPKNLDEIGLASLLYSIYTSNRGFCGWKIYIKSNFYEYICALSDLGVSSMAFMPIGFDLLQPLHTKVNEAIEDILIRKIYTDGTFELKNYKFKSIECQSSDLFNLKNANFLIDIHLNHHSGITNIENSLATVKNFKLYDNKYPCDSIFPTREELTSIVFPELKVEKDSIRWFKNIEYTQEYNRFNLEKLSCAKRLTKTPNGVYYYKEYHNK